MKYQRNTFLKWLTGLTLVLSLFAFSGFAATSHLQQKPKTEIGVSLKVKIKNLASFVKFQVKTDVSAASNNATKSIFSLLRFEQLIKTKHQASSKIVNEIDESTKVSKAVYTPRKAGYIS